MDTSKIDLLLRDFDLNEDTGQVTYTIALTLPPAGPERKACIKALKCTSLAQMLLMLRDALEQMPASGTEDRSKT